MYSDKFGKFLEEFVEKFIKNEAINICKKYKIDANQVREIIITNLDDKIKVLKDILENYSNKDITRSKPYKEFKKHIKKRVYYYLRQFQRNKDKENQLKLQLDSLGQQNNNSKEINNIILELLLCHVSTEERFPYYEKFYKLLFDLIKPQRIILDIGCGIHPLSYPFKLGELPEKYIAIDNNLTSINIIRVFAKTMGLTNLIPIHANISETNFNTLLTNSDDKFDIVFMLKLIPLIYRQNKNLIPKLINIPAHKILITGVKEAMTKKVNIKKREDILLKRFIKESNRKAIGSIEIENEFGYLLA